MKRLAALVSAMVVSCALFGLPVAGVASGPGPTPGTAPTIPATTATPAPLFVWRVFLRTPADVTLLTSGGWDVLEARGKAHGMAYLLVIGDDQVAGQLRAQGFTVEVDRPIGAITNHAPFTFAGGYHTVAEQIQHLNDTVNLHPDLALTVTYGVSWRKQQSPTSGYSLIAICITRLRPGDCALNPNSAKPRFFLMANIHARELSTAELAWRWIDLLVTGYGIDADITALLNDDELWVVPIANPDGRSIAETTTPPVQRKNTDSNYCPFGNLGVDLNRNASFQWGVSGASTNQCDDIFQGPSAASEPEELALEGLMRDLFPVQRGPALTDTVPATTTGLMLTLHSYSNLVLLPWGWTECYFSPCPANLRAPNDLALRALAFHMSYFNGYFTGQASEELYAASGTSDDWAYGVLGIPGFTFEVGPMADPCSGFAPAYSCQDSLFWPANRGAFLYAAKVASQPYALGLGPTVQPDSAVIVAPISTTVSFTAVVASDQYGAAGISRPATPAISAARYSIDAAPWITSTSVYSMTAQDGIFDSTTETVTGVLTASLAPGRHLVYIQGQDAAGNWGPTTARWLLVTRFTQRLILIYGPS